MFSVDHHEQFQCRVKHVYTRSVVSYTIYRLQLFIFPLCNSFTNHGSILVQNIGGQTTKSKTLPPTM